MGCCCSCSVGRARRRDSVRAVIPSETGALELRVRALYALNRHYQALMGLDPSWTRGNPLYRVTLRDLDALVDQVSELLALAPDERAQFVASREGATTQHRLDRSGSSTTSAPTPSCSRRAPVRGTG